MIITDIKLEKFRNLLEVGVVPSTDLNILYGKNAQGKTNFLEAIYYCVTGRSMRTQNIKEIINFNEVYSNIKIGISNDYQQIKEDHQKKSKDILSVSLYKKENNKCGKAISVNGLSIKKTSELLGVLYLVVFSPDDLALLQAGPAERRRFIDMELCQLSKVYYFNLLQYYQVLKQRNKLLKQMALNKDTDTLNIWDEQLIEYGTKIVISRKEFIHDVEQKACKANLKLTSGKENLHLFYKQSVNGSRADEISACFKEKLERNKERDIALGSTSVGIHKDDLEFYINGINAHVYGSQGQQRTAAISVKLAEIEIIKELKNERPVFLMDDVLSELDEFRHDYLLKSIQGLQAFITCTGAESLLLDNQKEHLNSKDSSVFYVEDGNISLVSGGLGGL